MTTAPDPQRTSNRRFLRKADRRKAYWGTVFGIDLLFCVGTILWVARQHDSLLELIAAVAAVVGGFMTYAWSKSARSHQNEGVRRYLEKKSMDRE